MAFNNNTYHVRRIKPKHLSAFINWFTFYHFTDNVPVKLIPEGYFELIFQLGSKFSQRTADADEWENRPEYFIGGLHNKSYYINPERPASSLISVNFKPNCTRYFIPDKLQLYKNRVVGLDDIFQKSELGQFDELCSSSLVEQKIEMIETFLAGNLRERSESRIDHALDAIVQRHGFINIGELTRVVCLSHSQLRKRFNEEVGMSPKEYSKILRVNFISQYLKSNPGTKLTHLSCDLGYFDQSHFIKDFKSVTGISPKKYLR